MILENPDQFTSPAKRIISLVPSQTSLLHYLGLEKETIGITKFCIHPQHWKKDKEIIGGTKNIKIEKIKKLKPDLIIANKEENVKDQIEALSHDFNIWVTEVNTVNDAMRMIIDIGQLTGTQKNAQNLVQQIDILKQSFIPKSDAILKKSIAYFIWKDPWMVAASGTYINDLIELSGFKNYFDKMKRYPTIDIKQIESENLDRIFLSSEPYPFKDNNIEELKAIFPTTNIQLVDGEMFSWYGDHLLKSLPYLKDLQEKIYL